MSRFSLESLSANWNSGRVKIWSNILMGVKYDEDLLKLILPPWFHTVSSLLIEICICHQKIAQSILRMNFWVPAAPLLFSLFLTTYPKVEMFLFIWGYSRSIRKKDIRTLKWFNAFKIPYLPFSSSDGWLHCHLLLCTIFWMKF